VIACSRLLGGFNMLRENFKAWSNGSEAYSSDPEEDEEEEEDMVFGESDQDGMSAEMMDLSDLPTALFACSIHDAVFEQDVHRLASLDLFYFQCFSLSVRPIHLPPSTVSASQSSPARLPHDNVAH
ncbi:hypothetical protein XENOCAPTIV_008062, partial [Xenoophorus captivus]